jgi:hypothetical protein
MTWQLPPLAWQHAWLVLGWSVVLAGLAMLLAGRVLRAHKNQAASLTVIATSIALPTALVAWVSWPGVWGGAHWLGLAFQAPSVCTVVLSAMLLQRCALQVFNSLASTPTAPTPPTPKWTWAQVYAACCGVLLGWLLLLDTLGVLPGGSWYRLGFGAAAPAVCFLLVAWPWVVDARQLNRRAMVLISSVAAVYMAGRLPTGNVFDALLDPWLWLALHGLLLRNGLPKRAKKSK